MKNSLRRVARLVRPLSFSSSLFFLSFSLSGHFIPLIFAISASTGIRECISLARFFRMRERSSLALASIGIARVCVCMRVYVSCRPLLITETRGNAPARALLRSRSRGVEFRESDARRRSNCTRDCRRSHLNACQLAGSRSPK